MVFRRLVMIFFFPLRRVKMVTQVANHYTMLGLMRRIRRVIRGRAIV